MPRAAVQMHTVWRGNANARTASKCAASEKSTSPGATTTTAVAAHRHERLRVRVVAVEELAAQPAVAHLELVEGVPDEVDRAVVPQELEIGGRVAVAFFGRQCAEGRERLAGCDDRHRARSHEVLPLVLASSLRSRFRSGVALMDVRSIEDVEPVVEHNGTVPVWWLVNPREMFDITKGGHLELVSEFEVAGGGLVDPHHHPTHEFYYVTSGRGIMTISGEEREIRAGRPRAHPAERGALAATGQRPRADSLLLLRGRRRRRGRDQLHRALTRWGACSSPAGSRTVGWIRSRVTRSSDRSPTMRRTRTTSCAHTLENATRSFRC